MKLVLAEKPSVAQSITSLGCGEFAAVETLAEICKIYKKKLLAERQRGT